MSFVIAGSLHSYANSMKMQMKWEQKQSKSDYTADGATSISEKLRKEASGIGSPASGNRSDAAIMGGIRAKLTAGKRLSSAELDYLKKNDPETYRHVKAMEMERKAFEQQLKNCKTKEEVQRLKASRMAASLDRVRDVNNNPNIPDGEKLKLTMEEHQKVSSITDATVEFAESGDYKNLPTEAEKRKAEKDLKEAKEAEMKGETKDDKDKVSDEKDKSEEVTDKNEDSSNTQEVENFDESSNSQNTGEHTDNAKSETAKTPNASPDAAKISGTASDVAKAREILMSAKKTRIQAELTPEAQKVRRAKARSAYTQNMCVSDGGVTIDLKQ